MGYFLLAGSSTTLTPTMVVMVIMIRLNKDAHSGMNKGTISQSVHIRQKKAIEGKRDKRQEEEVILLSPGALFNISRTSLAEIFFSVSKVIAGFGMRCARSVG